MIEKTMNEEEAFFVGMLYSCEYGKVDKEIEFFFKNKGMYDFIERFLIKRDIEYKMKFEGFRVLINIKSFEKLKDFLFCFGIDEGNILYHEIPLFIYESKKLYKSMFCGILETSGIELSNKEETKFTRVFSDSSNMSDFIRNIATENKLNFIEGKMDVANVEEKIDLFDILRDNNFLDLFSSDNLFEHSRYKETKV